VSAAALSYDIHHLEVTTGGDVAFRHSLTRLRGTTIDGETSDIWFRQTLCFRKIDVEWKITHEHESVPFYMDGSVRAAVDLQP
jgi:PhnB protein